jgi:hypothetical protein
MRNALAQDISSCLPDPDDDACFAGALLPPRGLRRGEPRAAIAGLIPKCILVIERFLISRRNCPAAP